MVIRTNIDDLPEKCLTVLNTRNNEHPKYRIFNYLDVEPVTSISLEPPIVHLHGCISKPDDGFIFDSVSYADVTVKSNDWISKSAIHILHGQCLFIGSKFKESDIEAAIRQRTISSTIDSTYLPRSWIVLDKIKPLEHRAYLNRGIIPIEATAEEFFSILLNHVQVMSLAKFLKRKAPHLKTIDANPSTAWFSTNMTNVASRIDQEKKRSGLFSRFFFGDMPDWFYVGNGIPANLRVMQTIRNEILTFENGDSPASLLNIIGSLGSGKTTSCMMSIAELSKTHSNVYMFTGLNALEIEHTWRVIKDMKGLVVIYVDSASSSYYAINAIMERMLDKSTSCKLCFIAEERSVQFRRNRHHLGNIPKAYQKNIEIHQLSHDDAYSLYDKTRELGIVYEKLKNISREQAVRRIIDCDNGYKGDLFATLYDLSSSKSYQEKLTDEFHEIKNQIAIDAFQIIALVSAARLAIPLNYLAETLGLKVHKTMEIIDGDLRWKIYLNKSAITISSRHHSIAQYHIQNNFEKLKLKNNILALMSCLSKKFNVSDIKHHPVSYKIYSNLMSQYFLREIVFPGKENYDLIDEIYSSCQRFFAQDGIFWLQYGRFLEKVGKVDDALHCFRKGLALYDSFQIRHALGQVLIKKYRLAKIPDRNDLEEGVNLLKIEIERRGSTDCYPYTALGGELIELVHKGLETAYCLSILKETINRGLVLFREDEIFMKMVQRYLSLDKSGLII